MVVVNPVGETFSSASVVVAIVIDIIFVTKVIRWGRGGAVSAVGAVGRIVIAGRIIGVGVVPASIIVAFIIVDPVASTMAAVASSMVAIVTDVIVISKVAIWWVSTSAVGGVGRVDAVVVIR